MSAQAADVHLLRRLSQLEKDLNGMCKELHRRRSPTKISNHEPRTRASAGHSKEQRRNVSPSPQLVRSASRGERRNPSKSPSTSSLQHWDPKLSAVLEAPPCERRAGASREDCGSNAGVSAWTGRMPSARQVGSPRKAGKSSSSSVMSRSPIRRLSKSQSTTTAGLGSSSSDSCAALVVTKGPLRMRSAERSEAASTTPRSRQAKTIGLGQSPSTLTDTSLCKSVGAPAERIDLGDSGDSNSSRADTKRDLVWQLELEKLRNATLKLEVQREICESSDLKKRLVETEKVVIAPSQTFVMPAVSSVAGVPLVSTASVSRLPVSQTPAVQPSLVNSHSMQYSPRHRSLVAPIAAPSAYTQRLN